MNKQSDQNKSFELLELRDKIDQFDRDLVVLLAKRMDIIDKITAYKEKNKLPILQPERWKEITSNALTTAQALNVNEELIRDIFKLIHQNSIEVQSKDQS
jgi:chorismate mutase